MKNKELISIKAQSITKTHGEIMIYGNIVDRKYWEDDDTVSAKSFDAAVKELGSGLESLHLRVNSYGGSVFAGQAIVSMIDTLRSRKIKTTSKIDGIAASMGSVVPQATDFISMAENAMFMMHKPSSLAWGNSDEMRDTADMLDKAEKTLVALYMRRFTGTEDELKDLLRGAVDGTWLTADEALEYGLIDQIDEPVELVASADKYRFNGIMVPAAALKGVADKIQTFENEGGEKEMLYNKETDDKIKAFLDEGKTVSVTKDGDNYTVVGAEMLEAILAKTDDFLTAQQVQEATKLEDVSADIVLGSLKDLIAAGIDITSVAEGLATYKPAEDTESTKKAKAYDGLLAVQKAEALKNGVRAKGDAFASDRWGKTLDGFSYEEIVAQGAEWLAEAKFKLKAGQGRQSRTPERVNASDLPDELFKVSKK